MKGRGSTLVDWPYPSEVFGLHVFGWLTNLNGSGKYSAASPTRFVVGGGHVQGGDNFSTVIEYVQFATTGSGIDFGDFSSFGRRANSFNNTSNGHGGL